MAWRRRQHSIGVKPARARLAWLLAVAVLLQALLPTPATLAAFNGAETGVWIEICSTDGHGLVKLSADGQPVSQSGPASQPGLNQHCPLCWAPGPVAILPELAAAAAPVVAARDDAAILARRTVVPPAWFLSRLKSRAPPVAA